MTYDEFKKQRGMIDTPDEEKRRGRPPKEEPKPETQSSPQSKPTEKV